MIRVVKPASHPHENVDEIGEASEAISASFQPESFLGLLGGSNGVEQEVKSNAIDRILTFHLQLTNLPRFYPNTGTEKTRINFSMKVSNQARLIRYLIIKVEEEQKIS